MHQRYAGRPKRRNGFSVRLLGRPDEHLVDGDASGPGDDVADRVGDVFGLQPFDVAEPLPDALQYLRAVVERELGRRSPRLNQGDPDVPLGDLLPQSLAERADAELRRVVDGAAVA